MSRLSITCTASETLTPDKCRLASDGYYFYCALWTHIGHAPSNRNPIKSFFRFSSAYGRIRFLSILFEIDVDIVVCLAILSPNPMNRLFFQTTFFVLVYRVKSYNKSLSVRNYDDRRKNTPTPIEYITNNTSHRFQTIYFSTYFSLIYHKKN